MEEHLLRSDKLLFCKLKGYNMFYTDLLESYEDTKKLGELASLDINRINEETEGGDIPLRGLNGQKGMVAEEDSEIIVGDDSILISVLGQPKAIVTFENMDLNAYLEFFNSEEFLTKLENLREADAKPKTSLEDLEAIKVPVL